ncbi:peptide-methionine (R)-S-oxide reductase MsrB [Novilysobacter antarcticus]|uniref:peptide-methionine (R)-S-oxide reductase MsrB n=1 Tax=Novilysobacter antarcticus TaxID=2862543 RepID=UPI001C997F54|nr:peptide-methionine (R)-S-oxide reductase MsrB [Lysobacter antarcticus]
MNRRTVLQGLAAFAALPFLPACSRAAAPAAPAGNAAITSLAHPPAFWRDMVSPAAFKVLFESETERAGSSPLNDEKRDGTFVCAACYLPLFDSAHKYESGTGWPSFTQPIAGSMQTKRDFVMLIPRTEYHCARCGGHQGHVFGDGPPPLGKRWCNNGLALRFVPGSETLPALRG